jgi:hypothetical protein
LFTSPFLNFIYSVDRLVFTAVIDTLLSKQEMFVGLYVLEARTMRTTIFWVKILCILGKVGRFGDGIAASGLLGFWTVSIVWYSD